MDGSQPRRPTAPSVPGALRQRALDAALALLVEGGAEALHLRTLAARIGCGTGSLYYHFAGKEALLCALAEQGFEGLKAAMDAGVAGGVFLRDIDAVSDAYLTFMGQNLRVYALMYSERILATHPEVRAAEAQIVSRFAAALASDERVPSDRVEEASLAYSAIGRGIASLLLSRADLDAEGQRLLGEKIIGGIGLLLSTEFLLAEPEAPLAEG